MTDEEREDELADEMLARRDARESFEGYCRYSLPEGMVLSAHHKLMCGELDAVFRGDNDRLMLNVPPGSAKSTYGSVYGPAYFEGKNPHLSTLATSHSVTLSERFGRRVRNLLSEQGGGKLWKASIASDSAAAGRWATTEGGEYMAAGVGTGIAGFRADLGIIDDPVPSREAADSDLIRDKTWDWYVNDFFPRLKPGGRIVLIMTRWHEDDLAGRLLNREPNRWRVVKLPMEAREGDPLGRKPLERLWPEWFTDEMVEQAKRDPRAWSSLYQQEPRPAEGAEFRHEWINRYSTLPKKTNRLIVVDPAAGQRRDRGDYTSMWVLALGPDENVYVADMIRDRMNLTERVDALFELHRKWKPHVVRYERYGMMADVQAIKAEMERRQYRFRIVEVGGQVQKEARIRRLIPWFQAGRIWIPQYMWRERLDGSRVDLMAEFVESEYAAFPVGKTDDMLDALSRVAEPGMTLPWPDNEESIDSVLDDWGVLDARAGY